MKRIFDFLRKAYALRQTRRELYAMSDRMPVSYTHLTLPTN